MDASNAATSKPSPLQRQQEEEQQTQLSWKVSKIPIEIYKTSDPSATAVPFDFAETVGQLGMRSSAKYFLPPHFNQNTESFRREVVGPYFTNACQPCGKHIKIKGWEHTYNSLRFCCKRHRPGGVGNPTKKKKKGRLAKEQAVDEESKEGNPSTESSPPPQTAPDHSEESAKTKKKNCPFAFSVFWDPEISRWYIKNSGPGCLEHVGHDKTIRKHDMSSKMLTSITTLDLAALRKKIEKERKAEDHSNKNVPPPAATQTTKDNSMLVPSPPVTTRCPQQQHLPKTTMHSVPPAPQVPGTKTFETMYAAAHPLFVDVCRNMCSVEQEAELLNFLHTMRANQMSCHRRRGEPAREAVLGQYQHPPLVSTTIPNSVKEQKLPSVAQAVADCATRRVTSNKRRSSTMSMLPNSKRISKTLDATNT